MNFWFEFLNIYMNEKTITYHDSHDFKWQNINIYPILNFFLCSSKPFLAHWIVTTPKLSCVVFFSKVVAKFQYRTFKWPKLNHIFINCYFLIKKSKKIPHFHIYEIFYFHSYLYGHYYMDFIMVH
jgi:hypothetical protein